MRARRPDTYHNVASTPERPFDEALEQRRKIYYFARFCHKNRLKIAPISKLPWPEVFRKKTGISLDQYMQEIRSLRESQRQADG